MSMNKMDDLLNKIERRLRTRPLMLPDVVKKDKWVEGTIIPDSIASYSRYFPHMVRIMIDTNDKSKKRDGYFLIDTRLVGGAEILGVKDIAWDVYGKEDALAQQSSLGYYDYMSAYNNYSMDDVMLLAARADMTSVFNNSIFVDFKEPNMIRLQSVTTGDITGGLGCIPLDVFINHPPNLMTIEPTKMEVFENLCTSDVANFILTELQNYKDLETVFAGVNIDLSTLDRWADRREDFINELKESYVSPSNKNQPIMYCV